MIQLDPGFEAGVQAALAFVESHCRLERLPRGWRIHPIS